MSDNEDQKVIEKILYFKGLKENIASEKDQYKNYIIFQNDFLHLRVKELEDKITELNLEIKELESDNEGMEISKNNLKFYFKNEHELGNHYKKTMEMYEEEIFKFKNEYDILTRKLEIISIVFFVCVMISIYFDYFLYSIMIGFLITCIVMVDPFLKSVQTIKKLNNDDRIVRNKIEIERANLGNKYLDHLVDNF